MIRQKAEGRSQKAEGKRFLDNFTFCYILVFFADKKIKTKRL